MFNEASARRSGARTGPDVNMIGAGFSLYDSTGLIHGCSSSHHGLEVHPPQDQVQPVKCPEPDGLAEAR